QPKTGIGTHFGKGPPKREEFGRRDVDFLLLEKTGGQSGASKQCRYGYLLHRESLRPSFGNSESISHQFDGLKLASSKARLMVFPSDFLSSWSATDLPRALTKGLMGVTSVPP